MQKPYKKGDYNSYSYELSRLSYRFISSPYTDSYEFPKPSKEVNHRSNTNKYLDFKETKKYGSPPNTKRIERASRRLSR